MSNHAEDLVRRLIGAINQGLRSAAGSGELMGVPATGKSVSVHGTIHSRVENGRIVEEWELLELSTMYQQLGLAEGR